MYYDCGFQKENHWFRYRTGAIIIHDGKMLFVKSSIGDYLYMIGGAVRLGETSVSCIEREVSEETGIKARVERLSVICENFFKGRGGDIDGMDCHTVEFYFRMTVDDLGSLKTRSDMGRGTGVAAARRDQIVYGQTDCHIRKARRNSRERSHPAYD